MKSPESNPMLEKSLEAALYLKRKNAFETGVYDVEKPHQSPEFYEIHKHIENLLAYLAKPRPPRDLSLPEAHENSTFEELHAVHLKNIEKNAKKTRNIVTNVTDFIPVVGSIKMILEGLEGRQYVTHKEIKGISRIVHTIAGAVFLGLDLTGVGAIASELGKGVIKLGERAMLRSLEEKLAREAIEKEAEKLVVRGEKRIKRKKKIENSA